MKERKKRYTGLDHMVAMMLHKETDKGPKWLGQLPSFDGTE